MLAKRKKKMNFKTDSKRTFSIDMISSTHTELQKERKRQKAAKTNERQKETKKETKKERRGDNLKPLGRGQTDIRNLMGLN